MLDYKLMSKLCAVCKKWENCDQEGDEFKKWQEEYKGVCEANFTGSAGAIKPGGISECFCVSWTSTYCINTSPVTVTPRHTCSYRKKNLTAMDIMWKK